MMRMDWKYPTLVEDEIYINNTSYITSELTVSLYSLTGNSILKTQLKIAPKEAKRIALPSLKKGIYFISTKDALGHHKTTRIMK